jgi:hypothetical protein
MPFNNGDPFPNEPEWETWKWNLFKIPPKIPGGSFAAFQNEMGMTFSQWFDDYKSNGNASRADPADPPGGDGTGEGSGGDGNSAPNNGNSAGAPLNNPDNMDIDFYQYVPYDVTKIAKLPEELRNLLEINTNVKDNNYMPSVQDVQKDIMMNNPAAATDIICSQVYNEYMKEANKLRNRAALLLQKYNVPAILKPLPKNKCNPYTPTHTATSCRP